MKKFLSLVLALAMTMSLVTISAGAKEFTDDSKLHYEEAVDVISAVKVVDGYADGSFNPQATLTRGAAAKIICNLILGPTTAAVLAAEAAPYKDVPADHVFAGYIAFCQQQGIINGYADGTFRPAATLTSAAFMKMLLGALGYDPTIEGYIGANWSIQVAKRALNIGLEEGLDEVFMGTKAVTREEACLFAFNMLNTKMVSYSSKGTVIIAGSMTVDTTASSAKEEAYTFAEKFFSKLSSRSIDDEFGRPSTVWTLDREEIGTYAKTADLVYTEEAESGDIYSDLALTKTGSFDVYVDGVLAEDQFAAVRGEKLPAVGGDSVIVEVYEEDGVIVVVNPHIGEVVSVTGETKKTDPYVTIKEMNSAFKADFETTAFNEDDIVLYTVADGKIMSVVKAESVSGEVTKMSSKNGATIGGKTYGVLGNLDIEAGDEVVVYLTEAGDIIYMDKIEAMVKDLVYVLAYAKEDGKWETDEKTYYAHILNMNGSVSEVVLKDDPRKMKVAQYDFARMTTDSNGKATLKPVDEDSFLNIEDQQIADATIVKHGEIGSVADVKYNNATLFLLYSAENGTAKVYTGYKSVPTVKADRDPIRVDVLQKASNKFAAVTVIFVDEVSNVVKEEAALYILAADYEAESTKDGVVYIFNAVEDGKMRKVTLDAKMGIVPVLKDGYNVLVKSYETENGKMVKSEPTKHNDVEIASYVEGVMTVNYIDGKTVDYDAEGAVVYSVRDGKITKTNMKALHLNEIKTASLLLDKDEKAVETVFVELKAE